MRLSLLVKAIDRAVDGMVEVVDVGEGAIGEVVALEIAPASLDVVQLRCIFGQPLDGEPRPLGHRLGRQLAGVDRPVVHDDDQRLEALASMRRSMPRLAQQCAR